MRTYGRVEYEDGWWWVDCEPHVAIVFKRVFGRLHKQNGKSLLVKDTPMIAHQLLWLMQLYPLRVDGLDRMEQQKSRHMETMSAVEAAMSGRASSRTWPLALPPREYQKTAADLLLATGGLLLADDAGLGKTVSAIACLTDPRTRPALVVTLSHLPQQWKREIERFAPGLKVHILTTGKPYDLTSRTGRSGRRLKAEEVAPEQLGLAGLQPDFGTRRLPDVIVSNYHKLNGWRDVLAGLVKFVVFDECQELRTGPGTAKYDAAEHICEAAEFRLGLSATPIYNYGSEFYAVGSLLRPGTLGDRDEFVAEWCAGMLGKERVRDPNAFGSFLREQGLMLRRRRSEVGRELPKMNRIMETISCEGKEFEAVRESVEALAQRYLSEGIKGLDKIKAGGELDWVLRQATGKAKAPYVAQFVRMLVEAGERVVLYGWHREVYTIWMRELSTTWVDGEGAVRAINPVLYTGSESPQQKEYARKRFCEGDARVMVISLRAGAGLDGLQSVCRTVVFGELDWAPGVHYQCEWRVHRDGQTDPVMAYYLIADDGSDPVVLEVLGLKRQQLTAVINPGEEVFEKLEIDPEHIKRLALECLRRRGVGGDGDEEEGHA